MRTIKIPISVTDEERLAIGWAMGRHKLPASRSDLVAWASARVAEAKLLIVQTYRVEQERRKRRVNEPYLPGVESHCTDVMAAGGVYKSDSPELPDQ